MWLDDGPSVYFLRCAEFSEVDEHAVMVLCPEPSEGELTAEEMAEVWETGSGYGYTVAPDGSIRYTETLNIMEIRGKGSNRWNR